MPKRNIVQIELPPIKPDCCATCPLVGIVPKHLRQYRSKETHVCMGTMEALTALGINVRASQKDTNHRLRRPCDNRWEAWMLLPGRKIGISNVTYIQCRIPYEQTQPLQIKFHR